MHLQIYVKDEPGALVFPGVQGGPIRRGNFNKMSAWPQAFASIDMPGLHFYELRHTGNQFAANSGAGLRDYDGNQTRAVSLGICRLCSNYAA